MQEIKNHQEEVSHNLKSEIRDGIMETLQACNLSSMNQENIDPNTSTSMTINSGYSYPSGYKYPVDQNYCQQVDTNNVNQVSNASSFAELIKKYRL